MHVHSYNHASEYLTKEMSGSILSNMMAAYHIIMHMYHWSVPMSSSRSKWGGKDNFVWQQAGGRKRKCKTIMYRCVMWSTPQGSAQVTTYTYCRSYIKLMIYGNHKHTVHPRPCEGGYPRTGSCVVVGISTSINVACRNSPLTYTALFIH